MQFIMRVLLGALGGFVGGALVGLAEAVVVAFGGGGDEFGVFFFGAVAYGLFGVGMGAGWGFGVSILRFLGDEAEKVLATAGGLVVAALGLVVSRFRIVRDVFGESLPMASGAGIAVHVGLLVGAGLAFFLVRRLLLGGANDRGAAATGARWAGACVVGGFLATSVLNLVLGGSGPPNLPPATAKGPNVLLIIADTLRADHIGPYGSTVVKTPSLDRLAADGVVFENGFAQSSWTRPSIATILTSLYPASHSVMHKTDLLPDDVTTVAEVLEEAGYNTGGFVTNINVAPSFNFEQGFQDYRYLAPAFFFGATDSGSKLSLYSGMRLIRERFLSKNKFVQNYYQDALTVEGSALPWLDSTTDGAFFALVHYMDPHDPYLEIPYNGTAIARVDTPHPDAEMAARLEELYNSNVEYLDGFLGNLFNQLREAGVYDNTVIAFVADHGEEFYEHEGWWHGTTLYDEQIHIPFIIKLPAGKHAGSRRSELVQLLDVAPSLLAAAGVPAPDAFQGRDVFGDSKAPEAIYAEEDHEGNVLESVRTANWKLIVANEGNPRGLAPKELYNLAEDPGETNNVVDVEFAEADRLENDLKVLRGRAAGSAVSGASGELDEATKERLRKLGYMD